MIKVLVVEDEHLVAQRLIRFIRQATDKALNIQFVKSIADAQQYLSTHSIDLLFLDLNLNGKSGFNLLKDFINSKFHTVIVSAYTDKALEAFEYGVLDFIGKPFTIDRLSKAMDRYFNLTMSTTGVNPSIPIRIYGDILFIQLTEVKYIQADGIYSNLICMNGNSYVYDKPLNALMEILPDNYCRIHRSYAIDLKTIIAVKKIRHNAYHVILQCGESLPISRKIKKELTAKLSLDNH
ncbi:MAG: LytTR family DNA-binding domain-containing protein [Fulvivirga sp.]|uniref:LytR/AlgR family response regulator transcription factor n=1 Tax=Fulvivirga sp. TaxID=1931237 RepID=UPI0032F6F531